MVTLKLAQVSLFLDQLGVVVFAVEPPLMCDVVGWADRTPAMGAFETALVICSSIHGDLLSRIDSILTAHAFISGSRKHARHFICYGFLTINWFLWFHNFWCPFKAFV